MRPPMLINSRVLVLVLVLLLLLVLRLRITIMCQGVFSSDQTINKFMYFPLFTSALIIGHAVLSQGLPPTCAFYSDKSLIYVYPQCCKTAMHL